MLGKQTAALGTVAVEQTLSGQTAAGQGQQVDLVVVAFINTQRVDAFIK